jgi:hypothetical protein
MIVYSVPIRSQGRSLRLTLVSIEGVLVVFKWNAFLRFRDAG